MAGIQHYILFDMITILIFGKGHKWWRSIHICMFIQAALKQILSNKPITVCAYRNNTQC